MIRGDLRNHQGFCLLDPHGTLYDDVVRYCAQFPATLPRDIVLLNLSTPDSIVGFNPFTKAGANSVPVQVDRRIAATMHAWNIKNTDETPTLERILRLIYTVMIEQNLGLGQVQHLIDFNAQTIRDHLIDQLQNPLIQREWRELQQLKAKDWREEILSAKNKLFRFLTSPVLTRFMGLPERTLDLKSIMDAGKILLVKLAPSDDLSEENARAFGALLVNEFFECARRREKDAFGGDPKPFYLYIDEFQEFISLDVSKMLDQVRKFGLFTILSHQRFGQLDDDLIDSLSNCKIKAVFGGLPVKWAQYMAEEMFIGKLDPKKVKVAIYQTKFWPQEETRQVRTHSESHSASSGWTDSSADTTSSGSATGEFFGPDQWFSGTGSAGRSTADSAGRTSVRGSGSSGSESSGKSDSVADIPVFVPVPFQELSSVQYYPLQEQITEFTAALKNQFKRHCFVKIQNADAEPMLVPKVEESYIGAEDLSWYERTQFSAANALPVGKVDQMIAEREAALLQAAQTTIFRPDQPEPGAQEPLNEPSSSPFWNRRPSLIERKRGPKTDLANYAKVAQIVNGYGSEWTADGNLVKICEELDRQKIPPPKTWISRREGPARSWTRGRQLYPQLVIRAIKDRLEALEKASSAGA